MKFENLLYNSHFRKQAAIRKAFGDEVANQPDSFNYRWLREKAMKIVKNNQTQVLKKLEVSEFSIPPSKGKVLIYIGAIQGRGGDDAYSGPRRQRRSGRTL